MPMQMRLFAHPALAVACSPKQKSYREPATLLLAYPSVLPLGLFTRARRWVRTRVSGRVGTHERRGRLGWRPGRAA